MKGVAFAGWKRAMRLILEPTCVLPGCSASVPGVSELILQESSTMASRKYISAGGLSRFFRPELEGQASFRVRLSFLIRLAGSMRR